MKIKKTPMSRWFGLKRNRSQTGWRTKKFRIQSPIGESNTSPEEILPTVSQDLVKNWSTSSKNISHTNRKGQPSGSGPVRIFYFITF
jgi:hypothetical protein